ncbi:MAG: elongation factor 4 [Candidatus Harrisonbacteria bacterium RIFCSPLOWO2_01_FULL_40_28]|uniref:Elongation factor 4 n=1 Tax=Candidatus Harrisonbacteria bacterium RIFCSPLOWO2_01_FULL_40_28 TaxID=1798406 RepID=A0A1G1ZM18_9BACT|nr:MAG: elongation factor 4 [Candidatus Harrisonbacteria bacterium RIFCSPLOWO2_01_FULL_40_28]
MKQAIRNFVIIAHIDHGKSTLADRLLEITGTIPGRSMKPQFLDQLELERERGITIKMAPVRMNYVYKGESYILNLIDTPGHPDFSYEVSRALAAVEGAILLVDATQGIQAQTLANLRLAEKAGLKIVGVLNKVDLRSHDLDPLLKEVADLIHVSPSEIFKVSGKTGVGVEELLGGVIERVPPPYVDINESKRFRAMIFNSFYDDHQGIIASLRVFSGTIKTEDEIRFAATQFSGKVKMVGHFLPTMKASSELNHGEIGYLVMGLKDPEKIRIGDTVIKRDEKTESLPGYKEPKPVVFVSFYPEDAGEYNELRIAISRLRLSDSSFQVEPDYNEVLGRGYRLGFLGRLHFEVTAERLLKEFDLQVTNSFPSVAYRVKMKNDKEVEVRNPKDFSEDNSGVFEPIVAIEILTPLVHMGRVMQLKEMFRWRNVSNELHDNRAIIKAEMPLAELISDFDDRLRSASEGYASFSYEFTEWQSLEANKVEVLVNDEIVPGLTRIIPKERVMRESRIIALRLKDLLPKQQFAQAIQVKAGGRILARETISALRKDVTGYLYGGDRTRKMKLWKKQKEGKERLKQIGKVRISPDVFNQLLKSDAE